MYKSKALIVTTFLALAGCAHGNDFFSVLIGGNQNLSALSNYYAFKPDPLSGITKRQEFSVSVIKRNPSSAEISEYDKLFGSGNKELATIVNQQCRIKRDHKPGQRRQVIFDISVAGIVSQIASVVFDKVFDELDSRIERLKKASIQSYSGRIVAGSNELRWDQIDCILLTRSVEEKPEEVLPKGTPPKGLQLLLKLRKRGDHASSIFPIYSKMNFAQALTGAPQSKDESAIVATTVNFVVKAIDLQKGRPVPYDVSHGKFEITMPIGKSQFHCKNAVIQNNLKPCASEILVSNPSPKSSAISVGFSVLETGSAADDADKALAASKALRDILDDPFNQVINAILSN